MLRQPARIAKLIFSLLMLLATASIAAAQGNKPLDFERDFFSNLPEFAGPQLSATDVTFAAFIVPPRDGAPPLLAVQANVAKGFHIYSLTQPDNGPLRTGIKVDKSPAASLAGPFHVDHAPEVSQKDEYWPGVKIEEHRGVVTWLAPLKLSPDADLQKVELSGRISGQLCTDNLGSCRPFELLGDGFDRWTAKIATEEQLASFQPLPAAALATSDAAPAGGAPVAVGQFAARDNNPIIRGHIEPKVVAPGGIANLVLSIEPQAGWHVYLREDKVPKAGSRPTLIVLTNTSGLDPHSPSTETKVVAKGAQSYYDGPATWTVQFPIPKNAQPGDYKIEGLLAYQICSDKMCLGPAAVQFQGVVAVDATSTPGQLPVGFDESSYASAMTALETRVAWIGGSGGVIDYAAIQEQARAERASIPMAAWLAIAVLAGFILNFMPCVLPVIGLKVMSFVQQAGEDRGRIFLLNFVYALGMISVFWVLATLAVFLNFSWGDQFQSVGFNVALAAIVFVFALSFLGVWEVPIPGFVGSGSASKLAEREGLGGAFAKGILTTLLATPCTGPMLGPALGWAVEQPPLYAYLAFTCVGLGMALPYIVIGAQPALLKFLPRPGAWMETFKNIMGFVLMATVVFILTYIPWEFIVPTVAFVIGLWAACWWIGRKQHEALDTSKMIVNWAGAATFAAIIGMISFMWLDEVMRTRLESLIAQRIGEAMQVAPATSVNSAGTANTSLTSVEESPFELPWEKFTQETMEKHIAAGRTVFVDFTADWCLVCKNNERAALNVESMRKLVDDLGVVTLKADLTRPSPELKEMMRKLGHTSGALPFYAVFPANKPNEPILFSGWQTPGYFLDQVRAAGPSQTPVANRTAMMPAQ